MSETATRPRRGYPVLAWLVILGVVGFILYRNATKSSTSATAAEVVVMQAQARLLVAMHDATFPGAGGASLYKQTKEALQREPVDASTYSKRLRLAVMAGELVGPREALDELAALEEERQTEDLEAASRSIATAELLRQLYLGYEAGWNEPGLPAEKQAELRAALRWFGDLALAPAGGDPEARAKVLAPAYRALYAFFVLFLGGIVCLFTGVLLLIVVAYLAAQGRLRGMADSGRGGIYAETFAVYMLLYVAIGFTSRYLPEGWSGLWVNGLAMLLSLAALAWPVVRGVPWRQVRADLGLSPGRQPLLEILYGVGSYVCAVPVLAVAVLFIAILSRLRPAGPAPTHPIIGVALEKGWWIWVQVFLVACVLAPLVEEIMFRGALYRHVREASDGWGRGLSVAFSALATGFVFAVIHPQGWLAVPALGGLAVVFALVREWRQTLVPPMIAHGINNGVSTLMLLLVAS